MRFVSLFRRFSTARQTMLTLGVAGLCAGMALTGPAAQAQVTFSLTPASISYTPSTSAQTIRFSGTIANLGSSTVFLNGISISLDPSSASFSSANDNIFFDNTPVSLAGGSSYSGLVFGVDLNAGARLPVFGTATITGGATDSSNDTLGTPQRFSAFAAPEPSALPLTACGLLAMTGVVLVRRRSAR